MSSGIIKIRKSEKDKHHNDKKKKDKPRSTKHYTESKKSTNTNPIQKVLRKGW